MIPRSGACVPISFAHAFRWRLRRANKHRELYLRHGTGNGSPKTDDKRASDSLPAHGFQNQAPALPNLIAGVNRYRLLSDAGRRFSETGSERVEPDFQLGRFRRKPEPRSVLVVRTPSTPPTSVPLLAYSSRRAPRRNVKEETVFLIEVAGLIVVEPRYFSSHTGRQIYWHEFTRDSLKKHSSEL